jgi:hypothetical protein
VTDPIAPLLVDPSDLDAVGVLGDVVLAMRHHALVAGTAAIATVHAPEGWHRVVLTCQPGGHTVVGVRFGDLTRSRANNVGTWLERRGWQVDEDGGGARRRLPPGTDAASVAMDVLAVVTAAGAPSDPRTVTAVDAAGGAVDLFDLPGG